ncbi:SDR family oxidoreductase [Ancylomarina sp. 16SWW S1-10-2]|uniref:SDR family oxidoreductase n=1 Tax=Ancylomarina sp. 16SWW S1-10-2 TaxID=2499681 RepID=UPI0012ADED67|nr:SDR family oxidoreductase [Ancylomarina sp. 16SWW S1-10-2]MRT92886.1 SDR family oxidoreductase [Ancylomarina sp. 16SWW S1-10-2]
MKKTILITGASSGIGKETAKYFHEKGWNVIATMRTPEKEDELTKLDNVLVSKLDVTDLESINNAISGGIEKFGKIDALVNNAGYAAYGPLEAFPREKIIRQFNTNVIGVLDVTRAILPHFRANKDGVIVNISSMGGKMTFPLGSLYHGTKFAIEGISESLHFELEPIGIKVKIVEPGVIATDFGGRSFDFNNDPSMEEYQGTVDKLIKFQEHFLDAASEPIVVAEQIYAATTDGTNKIRYEAGQDAVELLDNRKKLDDETFIGGIKQQFGF